MSRASSDAHGRAPVPRMILVGSATAMMATLVAGGVLWAMAGVTAAASALGAGLVVILTFVTGILALAFILAGPGAQPHLALPGALLIYSGQLVALVALALTVRGSAWLDGTSVAAGGLLAAVGWMAGQVWGFVTSRVLVHSHVEGVSA